MFKLKDKVILVISPQSWGDMFVSKHHYAIELAKYGNTVFFLNPPDQTLANRISITPYAALSNLFIIRHRIIFPYDIKFHAIGIFHWLMQWQVKKILAAIGRPIDIVWSFDLGHLYPFRLFRKDTPIKIFHPVDEPVNSTALESGKGSHFIFSVTREILRKYEIYDAPKHFINHGVSDIFLQQKPYLKAQGDNVRVGFSGNLLRPDIDRPVLLQIVRENPQIIFECWGSCELGQANIGGSFDRQTAAFIGSLQQLSNVRLHGAVPAHILAADYQRIDAFLICYDVEKDQSKGTNYHKVMEYLAAGKVIISNNITTYQNMPGLVSMISQRDNNLLLPDLFKRIIANLTVYNSDKLVAERKNFAGVNTYEKQVEKIEKLLAGE